MFFSANLKHYLKNYIVFIHNLVSACCVDCRINVCKSATVGMFIISYPNNTQIVQEKPAVGVRSDA